MLNSIFKITLFVALIFEVVACDQNKNEENLLKDNEVEITKVKRYGSVIKIKPEMMEQYKKLHAKPWKEVSEQITRFISKMIFCSAILNI
jgi:uncharacterized lipoprotein YehR (DUF1307 family)